MPESSKPLIELGDTGLSRQSGEISEERLPALKGGKAMKVFREMADNDPVIGSMLFAIDMLIRQVEWPVEPFDESPEATADAEFVDSALGDMSQPWRSTVSEALSFLEYGYSPHEIVYKVRGGPGDDPTTRSQYSDGLLGWRKWPIRAQTTIERWEFDDDGGLAGVRQRRPDNFEEVTIPIEKLLLFRTTTKKGNPEGRSVLRSAYRPWYFKKKIEEIEGVGIERDLAGLPVIYVPPELLAKPKDDDPEASQKKASLEYVKRLVRDIRRDRQEGVVMPLAYDSNGEETYRLELLSAGGQRQFDTSRIITRYDQRIAMTVLADFILLGHDKVGSFALSSDKTELFAVAVGAWLDEICDVVNRHAIPRLFALNGFEREGYPRLTHSDIEKISLSELGDYIAKIAAAGAPVFPNEDVESHLFSLAGIPTTATGGPRSADRDPALARDEPAGGATGDEDLEERP